MKSIAEETAMATLITKACAGRSMTEFGKSCGVSPMHISRIKSGACRPSVKMCLRLGNETYARQLGLSSKDFLEAAGYEDDVELESVQSFEKIAFDSFDTIAIGVVTKKLMNRGIGFQVIPFKDRPDVDFALKVLDDDTIKVWNICLSNRNRITNEMNSNYALYYYLGRMLTFEPAAGTQYTIIMDSEADFDQIESHLTENMVKANVSVALLDQKQMAVVKEIHRESGNESYISLLN